MNPDGTGETRVSSATLYELRPAWSPDGSRIAFTGPGDSGFDIYVMQMGRE
jgi:Tol biopolymer transport system component